jgi:hypothetical protein
VGVGLVVGAFYALLALFNPRCALTLGRGDLALGETAELRWEFTGRFDRIHRLVLRVEGREEATYRRGTSTYTDKNVFYALDLVDTLRPAEIRSGTARFTVPADTMHSLSAGNNRIVWGLVVHGHIHGWPDVKDEYALTVGPLPKPAAAPLSEAVDEGEAGEVEDVAEEPADDEAEAAGDAGREGEWK